MKLKVLEKFTDKNDLSVKYAPGQVIEIADAERATNLIRKGWCALVSEETQKPENTPKPDNTGKGKGNKKSGKKSGDKEDAPADDQGNASGDKEDAPADATAEGAADAGTAAGDQE